MYKKYLSLYLFFVILSISQILPIDATAYETGTIVTKDGQRFENVTYDVLDVYKIIRFKIGNDEKNISFTKVEAIYNSKGTDITASVIGGYYQPQKENWRSETDPVVKKSRKAKYAVGWRLGSNYSIPVTDYYDGIEPGIGFEGELLVGITHNLGLRLMVSKSGMKVEDGYSPFYWPMEFTVLKESYKITTIRYMISFQYYHVQGEIDNGKTMFYTYSGLGAVSQKVTPDVLLYDNVEDVTYFANESLTETKFAINIGAGATVFFSKAVGIDFSINADEVFVGNYSYGNSGLAFIIDFKIGLVVLLR